jgi:hypothetical protein
LGMVEPHEISRDKEPIRLFKSDFLEFFTHIHPLVIVLLWAPVMVYFLVKGILDLDSGSFGHIPLGFLAGIFLWTFAEYMLHRFVFHYPAKTERAKRITFLYHGIHHAQPMVKTRLVMPPIVSIPLAFLFYGLYHVILVEFLSIPQWLPPIFSGFLLGYLFYDTMHYSTHHIPMPWSWYKYIKFNHMAHHFKTPEKRFGVSSGFWDIVFRTKPIPES